MNKFTKYISQALGFCLLLISTPSNSDTYPPTITPTQILVPKNSIIPVKNNDYGIITVKNTGNAPAYHVMAEIPNTWTEVQQDSSECTTLPAHGECQLHFFTSEPYLAKMITIKSDNAPPQIVRVAFSVHGYLVFDIDKTKRISRVIYKKNLSKKWAWEDDGSKCIGVNLKQQDGNENSKKILKYYLSLWFPTDIAAVKCTNLTADKKGWYLPSVHQFFRGGVTGKGNYVDSKVYNDVEDNTINRLRIFGFMSGGDFWSSNEEFFHKGQYEHPGCYQAAKVYLGETYNEGHYHEYGMRFIFTYKTNPSHVRCVKDITY